MATSAPLLAGLISQILSITLEPGVQMRPNVNIRAQIQVMEYGVWKNAWNYKTCTVVTLALALH